MPHSENARPKDVGILAMEMYFPQRVRAFSCCLFEHLTNEFFIH